MKNPFKLEKPRALPMRFCSPENSYCWEDWHEENRKKHPVKYFISESIPRYFRSKIYSFDMFVINIKSRFFYKDHIFNYKNDFVSYEGKLGYKYGPLCFQDKMEIFFLKNFNLYKEKLFKKDTRSFLDFICEENPDNWNDFYRKCHTIDININSVMPDIKNNIECIFEDMYGSNSETKSDWRKMKKMKKIDELHKKLDSVKKQTYIDIISISDMMNE